MSNHNQFTLLYDGHCPLCSREINWLRSRDHNQSIKFQDIHDPVFKEQSPLPIDRLMAEIHGIDRDGRLLVGIDVFAVVYRLVGLNFLAAPLCWPLSRPLMKILYWVFAHSRPLLSVFSTNKYCHDGNCKVR